MAMQHAPNSLPRQNAGGAFAAFEGTCRHLQLDMFAHGPAVVSLHKNFYAGSCARVWTVASSDALQSS